MTSPRRRLAGRAAGGYNANWLELLRGGEPAGCPAPWAMLRRPSACYRFRLREGCFRLADGRPKRMPRHRPGTTPRIAVPVPRHALRPAASQRAFRDPGGEVVLSPKKSPTLIESRT